MPYTYFLNLMNLKFKSNESIIRRTNVGGD